MPGLPLESDVWSQQGPPGPIGFEGVTAEEGAVMDTSRDLTLSRVFAADEFLGVSQTFHERASMWKRKPKDPSA